MGFFSAKEMVHRLEGKRQSRWNCVVYPVFSSSFLRVCVENPLRISCFEGG